jgi:hypothetical protein
MTLSIFYMIYFCRLFVVVHHCKVYTGAPGAHGGTSLMAVVKVDLDRESLKRLAEIAVSERRPIPLQAEVLLMRAIAGWYMPQPPGEQPAGEPAGMREKG